jgi:hypothetical protein
MSLKRLTEEEAATRDMPDFYAALLLCNKCGLPPTQHDMFHGGYRCPAKAKPCQHTQTYVAVEPDIRCVSCGAHMTASAEFVGPAPDTIKEW